MAGTAPQFFTMWVLAAVLAAPWTRPWLDLRYLAVLCFVGGSLASLTGAGCYRIASLRADPTAPLAVYELCGWRRVAIADGAHVVLLVLAFLVSRPCDVLDARKLLTSMVLVMVYFACFDVQEVYERDRDAMALVGAWTTIAYMAVASLLCSKR